ncbi:MAG: hypothetical protein HOD92_03995 [Deltaproteobacteria bacterium]|jgi:hypothetical protein|nr:hypothetical protein [Deltaproteobacteria bacterium]MBT4526614.1 hypothetical protein [Deltaproteobacteria bacterium]
MHRLPLLLVTILIFLVSCGVNKLIIPSKLKSGKDYELYKRITVKANAKGWVETGVELRKGHKVLVFASGLVDTWPGVESYTHKEAFEILLMKIGQEAHFFAPTDKNQKYFTISSPGKVTFYVKEEANRNKDNTGEFTVDLFVLKEHQEVNLAENLIKLSEANKNDLDFKKNLDSFFNSEAGKEIKYKKIWLKYSRQDTLIGYLEFLENYTGNVYNSLAFERIDEIIYRTYNKYFWNLKAYNPFNGDKILKPILKAYQSLY